MKNLLTTAFILLSVNLFAQSATQELTPATSIGFAEYGKYGSFNIGAEASLIAAVDLKSSSLDFYPTIGLGYGYINEDSRFFYLVGLGASFSNNGEYNNLMFDGYCKASAGIKWGMFALRTDYTRTQGQNIVSIGFSAFVGYNDRIFGCF